ncbi:DUF4013 domain-containing protein [Halobaculum lipolyticum]|uniref:DUF4013 domain-containing protein n=1 Tax=Halobaculum lipolyticum TaxID=3032001 RepID=A0ABD5WDK6_9EURY|nr:DUF4013 domain-containing protein [Halobaculum sp. DT31]
MLEDAIRYPLNNDDRLATLIIGGLLVIPGVFLILPIFILQGYLVRVLGSAAAGEESAPSFTDWGGLFVDGLKLLVVQIVYGLVLLVPFGALFFVVVGGSALVTGDAGVAALGVVGFLVLGLFVLASLVVSYVVPAALTNMAVEGTLGAAFDVGAIRTAALSADYLVGVLLGVVLAAVIGSIASPLTALLVGIPLLFYAQVVSYYCFGRGFAEATGAGGVGGSRTADPTATDTL